MPAAGVAGGAARGAAGRSDSAASMSQISPSSMSSSNAQRTRASHGLLGIVALPPPQQRSLVVNFPAFTPGKIVCSVATALTSSQISGSALIWIRCAQGGGAAKGNIARSAGPLGKHARRAAAHATVSWPEGSGGLARASAGLGSARWACQLTLKVPQRVTATATSHVLRVTKVRVLSHLTPRCASEGRQIGN